MLSVMPSAQCRLSGGRKFQSPGIQNCCLWERRSGSCPREGSSEAGWLMLGFGCGAAALGERGRGGPWALPNSCVLKNRGSLGTLNVLLYFLDSSTPGSRWQEYVKIQRSAAMTAHKGPPLGAGILQNADVTARLNVWPAGLEEDRWTQARAGLSPAARAPLAVWRGGYSRAPGGRVCGPWESRDVCVGGGGIHYSLDRCAAPPDEPASASPAKAYCRPVFKMINVTRRSGEARTLVQNFLRSPCSPRVDACGT